MRDRIFNNWQSTLQGLIIAVFALCLVIFKLATYTEVSGLFVISAILIFSKNIWIKKFFNKIPVLILLMLTVSCSTTKFKEQQKTASGSTQHLTNSSENFKTNQGSNFFLNKNGSGYYEKKDTFQTFHDTIYKTTIERYYFYNNTTIEKKDTSSTNNIKNEATKDSASFTNSETTKKEKKGFNFWFLIIPCNIIFIIFILWKVFRKTAKIKAEI